MSLYMARKLDPRSVSRNVSTTVVARKRRNLLYRGLPLALLCFGVLSTSWLLFSQGKFSQIEKLKSEHKAVELEISRLTSRIEFLKARAEALKNDPIAVERAARDQLGLVRQTEVVYHFSERP